MSPTSRASAVAACAWALAACATGAPYERDVAPTHAALDAGQPDRARAALEALLADGRRDGPEGVLLRLELGVVALHQGLPAVAAGALAQADPLLEVVDLTKDDAGELASWLFADAARPYRSPAWEKLMVNVLGMASRLSAGDHRGALVEARRFEVVARFFTERSEDPGRVLAVGRLLAGVAHEAAGRVRGARLYLEQAREALPALFAASGGEGDEGGEVVVLVLAGRLPAKVSRPVDVDTAARLAAQPTAAQNLRELGVKELLIVGLGADRPMDDVAVTVDGRASTVVWADLAATARADFERLGPKLARAAITRALSRQTVQRTVASADGAGQKAGLGHVLGSILAGSMQATDTPDTRSWSTLPARLGVARVPIAPGRYTVTAGGDEVTVEVRPGRPGFALLVVD